MLTSKIPLRRAEYDKLSRYIYKGYGITLPPSKRIMVEGRLQRRLRACNCQSFEAYIDLVLSPRGREELVQMVDRISTNKTDFFREPAHFHFLTETILPQYEARRRAGVPLQIWSAASSSGEEVYTICMALEEYRETHSGPDYMVYATDISTESLKTAIAGVYTADRVKKVPLPIRKKYFLRSKDRTKDLVRVVPNLRYKTRFARLNLMDPSLGAPNQYDIIFCRNVLIYFDRQTQEEVMRKQCQTLRKGGYIFLGHSESMMGLDLPLRQIEPTVYQKI